MSTTAILPPPIPFTRNLRNLRIFLTETQCEFVRLLRTRGFSLLSPPFDRPAREYTRREQAS